MTETLKLTDNQVRVMLDTLTSNVSTSRQQLMSMLLDPRRDFNAECGYPETHGITVEHYQNMYDRFCIATRVVEVLPLETWKVSPQVYEDEDPEIETPFEAALKELDKSLMDEDESWFEGEEESSPLWHYLCRADITSGIGHYGVLLLGINDGKTLDQPVIPSPKNELTFLRVLPEKLATINSLDSDPNSPRYGKPQTYGITLTDPTETSSVVQSSSGIGTTYNVHHSRVLHVVDNVCANENYSVPRQRPVFDRLLDLIKLYGGSAEGYWKGSFPGISLETHPQLGGDVTIDVAAIRTAMEQYQNGLQRYFALSGMAAKSLAPQVVDPTPQIKIQLEAICILLGIPMRVFLGSERGELSSAQDKDTWNGRVSSRQKNYISPRLIARFINKLIRFGILPPPQSYKIEWPDLNALTPAEESSVALQQTQAIVAYVGGGGDTLIEPMNYLTRILKLSDADAREVLEQTEEHVVEKTEQEEETQMRKIEEGLVPDPQPDVIPGAPPTKGSKPPFKSKGKEDKKPGSK